MSIPISQFIPPPPLSSFGVHTFVLYVHVSPPLLFIQSLHPYGSVLILRTLLLAFKEIDYVNTSLLM